eukprot:scaffold2655_cov400-Prasinococcus_capsulatus_cf.AAC.6
MSIKAHVHASGRACRISLEYHGSPERLNTVSIASTASSGLAGEHQFCTREETTRSRERVCACVCCRQFSKCKTGDAQLTPVTGVHCRRSAGCLHHRLRSGVQITVCTNCAALPFAIEGTLLHPSAYEKLCGKKRHALMPVLYQLCLLQPYKNRDSYMMVQHRTISYTTYYKKCELPRPKKQCTVAFRLV